MQQEELLALCQFHWYFGDTESSGARVAAHYQGATNELKFFDRLFSAHVYTPLFSPALSTRRKKEFKEKLGEEVTACLKDLNVLLFAVIREIASVDPRHSIGGPDKEWTPIGPHNEIIDKQAFLERSQIENKEQYYDTMRRTDLVLLPVVKSVRNRMKCIDEIGRGKNEVPMQLPDWTDELEEVREAIAERLTKTLPDLAARAKELRKDFEPENVRIPADTVAALRELRELIKVVRSSVDIESEKLFKDLMLKGQQ